jgi:hypothetical protein
MKSFVFAVLVLFSAHAYAGMMESMIKCSSIAEGPKRLECYDKVIESEKAHYKDNCQINILSMNVAGAPNIGMIQSIGEIKNVSDSVLERVRALALVYDKSGNLVASEDMGIEFKVLKPGEKSPFKVRIRYKDLDNVGKVVTKFTSRKTKLKSCSDKIEISD